MIYFRFYNRLFIVRKIWRGKQVKLLFDIYWEITNMKFRVKPDLFQLFSDYVNRLTCCKWEFPVIRAAWRRPSLLENKASDVSYISHAAPCCYPCHQEVLRQRLKTLSGDYISSRGVELASVAISACLVTGDNVPKSSREKALDCTSDDWQISLSGSKPQE